MYQYGIGIEANLVKAAYWYRKGMLLQILQKISTYFSALLSPAKMAGSRTAYRSLRDMFYQGKGVKAGLVQPIGWIRQGMLSQILECINTLSAFISLAVEAGIPEAEFQLGIAFQEGKGVKADQAKAFDLIEKGMMLQIIQNINTLSALLSPAAKARLPEAQYNLGRLYQNGKGVKADLVKAFYWTREGLFP
jgi:uncharacterized protein